MIGMRMVLLAVGLFMGATPAAAQEIRRIAPPGAAIASSVEVPPGSRLVYVSGTVPEAVNAAAPQGSVERFGDTAAQTRSVLRQIAQRLQAHGLDLSDVVMMRVFLVAPPGRDAMDFAGMMTAYREFFGTADQPNIPARSTMEVAGLVDPGWLVEIEVTAAEPAPGS
jgi:enamine deaminase RidA (YjgF/YER057c/UK114 family)